MPELPEVHTIVQDLSQSSLLNKKIISIDVFWPKSIEMPEPNIFCKQVVQNSIQKIERRAKYIIFYLSNGMFLITHLRMTGRLQYILNSPLTSPYIRLQLNFENGFQLQFHDTRKFGRWYLTNNLEDLLGHLGPEPLSSTFTLEVFKERILKKKSSLKPLLLDQTFIAGLGNIYVDEALWEAKLHPLQAANQLGAEEITLLYESIKRVLKKGIEAKGTTLGSGRTNYYRLDGTKGLHQTLLNVFRKTGLPCPRCGHLIEKLTVVQRSTHICTVCQKQIK
jgi:formamidopyrimidine-DNA glycosylase